MIAVSNEQQIVSGELCVFNGKATNGRRSVCRMVAPVDQSSNKNPVDQN
ncbi:MAG: hypothetical protein LBT09_02800 [Planctomycetaceae bacterium]|nr:hypothetical protein [Planctomycetaceae bacterium]